MRIMKYSAAAMGMTMLFLAGVVTLAIHAPVRTTSQGWTTTVTVENPNDPGGQERLTVQPGGHVMAAQAR